ICACWRTITSLSRSTRSSVKLALISSSVSRCSTCALCSMVLRGSITRAPGAAPLAQHEEVQPLDLLARPRRAAQEPEARSDARLVREAAQRDALGQARPAVVRLQVGDDALERQAVQRVARLGRWRRGMHAARK